MSDISVSSTAQPLARPIQQLIAGLSSIPYWLLALLTRISIAAVFWRSGQTKVDGWHLSDSAIDLFRYEYKLPLIDPVAGRLSRRVRRAFLPDPAGDRLCDPLCRAGAAVHDRHHHCPSVPERSLSPI